MRLSGREIKKLLIFTAAEAARRRQARGLKLNYLDGRPERFDPDAGAGVVSPAVDVAPDSFQVSVGGALIESRPAGELPLAQRYFLF